MQIAYFDCTSGISGDMTLGALIDAGAPVDGIESAIRSMGLESLKITAETVKKYGFRAVQVAIEHPPEHAHRHLRHIEEMLDRGELDARAREMAKQIFRKLGEAEAHVHGTTIEKVHFHEVGAIDSIADITGVSVALTALGIDRIESSAVPTGCGTVTIAHGKVGVPAPATAELLKGIPLAHCEIEAELTTPTGAAILRTLSHSFGPMPAMRIEQIGFGAGTMDLESQANVLRVLIGQSDDVAESRPVESDRIVLLESNIDDSTAEQLAWCTDRLLAAGAVDVYQLPVMMKKGRIGVQISVLCNEADVAELENILFHESSAIGIRRQTLNRTKLFRQAHEVQTAFGPVLGKVVFLPSRQWRFTPEHDSLAKLAEEAKVPLRTIGEAAVNAFSPDCLDPPAP